MTAPVCPECGGVLQIIEHCTINDEMMTPFSQRRDRPLPRKTFENIPAALCTACEFAIEIQLPGRTR